ncbi:MAG: epoxyqueuosine reductase QueH [Desulforhopalus sp.]
MKLLLHACCGPCTIFPFEVLRDSGVEVTAHFYNPNIHPFKEFRRRLSTFEDYGKEQNIPLLVDKTYGLKQFLRSVVYHENKRCSLCYLMRLEKSVQVAKDLAFDCFSTTLLYSKYQRHDELKKLCKTLSRKYDIDFFYQDFREGWQYGIDKSIESGMYRQPYCGCIYSEQERYDKSLRKK